MHKSSPTRYLPQRGSWPIRYHRPRPVALRIAVTVAILLGTFHFIQLHDYYRKELLAKFSPTVFTHLSTEEQADQESLRWQSKSLGNDVGSQKRTGVSEHRSEWKALGSGCEGDTYTYNGTVIKVYHPERTPFRNCVPGSVYNDRWPTEIPATLLLGKPLLGKSNAIDETSDFVPVVDYFLSPSTAGGRPNWHFVTPFIESGNLYKLSKRIRASPQRHSARNLDNLYRPSFNRLLRALEKLHTEHNLCHDDIKPDNVFIAAPPRRPADQEEPQPLTATTHWLLADLGNVRHPSHPYHASHLWTPSNHQLRDCRANDALRLLKSYVVFLRLSVDDSLAFDEAFYAGSEPWSRLYWRAVDDMVRPGRMAETALSAGALGRISKEVEGPENYPHYSTRYGRPAPGLWNPVSRMWLGYGGTLGRAVGAELGMGLGDKWARFWGMTALRGVPVGGCK